MIRYNETIVIVTVNYTLWFFNMNLIELKSNKIEYDTLLWDDSYCDCELNWIKIEYDTLLWDDSYCDCKL